MIIGHSTAQGTSWSSVQEADASTKEIYSSALGHRTQSKGAEREERGQGDARKI